MNQLPQFDFVVRSDSFLTRGIPQLPPFVSEGAGVAWTNQPDGVRAAGSGSSQYLTIDLPITGGEIMEATFQISAVLGSTIYFYYKSTGGTPITLYLTTLSANSGPRIIRFKYSTFDGQPQGVSLSAVGGGTIDLTINSFNVSIKQFKRRTIYPGNFKSLNFKMTRSLRFWSLVDSLEAGLELYGEDLAYINSLIQEQPSQVVVCQITVTQAGVVRSMPPVMLDLLTMQVLYDGKGYKAVLQLLQGIELSKLIANLNATIDLARNTDVDGFEVITANTRVTRMDTANASTFPTLKQRFNGTLLPTGAIQVTADQEINIGFGDSIVVNDGFIVPSGASAQPSLVSDTGRLLNLVGTIRVAYTRSHPSVVVQAILNNTNTWVNLDTNVLYNVNILYPPGSSVSNSYAIRVRNDSGSTHTVTFGTATGYNGSNLTLTIDVIYKNQFYGLYAKDFLKSTFDRIFGQYNCIQMPTLELDNTGVSVNGNFNTATLGSGWTINSVNPSNYYVGNADHPWALVAVGSPINSTCARVTPTAMDSYMLLLKFWISGVSQQDTTFGDLVRYKLTATWDYAFSTSGSTIEIYGTEGNRQHLLGSMTFTGSSTPTTLELLFDKRYDALGLVAKQGTGQCSLVSFTVTSLGVASQPAPGEFAFNSIHNGNATREVISTERNNYLPYSTFDDSQGGIQKIFGMAVEPKLLNRTDQAFELAFVKIEEAFSTTPAITPIYAQESAVTIDANIAYDSVTVGGPYKDDNKADLASSCVTSVYSSPWLNTQAKRDLSFGLILNTALIVNREVSESEIFMLNLYDFGRVRLQEQLTVTNTESPAQFNWLLSEGRVMRRNNFINFSSGSNYFKLVSSPTLNKALVNYSGDSYGPISDANLITGTGGFLPYACTIKTEMSLSEFNQMFLDKYNLFDIYINNVLTYRGYLKDATYNFASAVLNMTFWIKERV